MSKILDMTRKAMDIRKLNFKVLVNPQTHELYMIDRFLGLGGTGFVYEVTSGNEHYAAKLSVHLDTAKNELKIYEIMSHFPECNSYIVCLYDYFVMDPERPISVLILELMKNTLSNVHLADEEVPMFVLDMLESMVALHARGIVHNDMHEGNVYRSLPGDGPLFKLGDFSESVIDAGSNLKEWDDWSLARMFLRELYQSDILGQRIPKLPMTLLIYPRQESSIPSDALETMIRGMLEKRWSSKQALDYILSIIQR